MLNLLLINWYEIHEFHRLLKIFEVFLMRNNDDVDQCQINKEEDKELDLDKYLMHKQATKLQPIQNNSVLTKQVFLYMYKP